MIDTPGGIVESNKFINLSFKRKHDNLTWTSRFYLMPDIPLGLLGGKNLLESFGFVFPDGLPLCFRHPEELELDMQLEMEPVFKPICNKNKCNMMYLMCKQSLNGIIAENTSMTNKLYIGNKVIYDYSINKNDNLTHYHAKEQQQRMAINNCKMYNKINDEKNQESFHQPQNKDDLHNVQSKPHNTNSTKKIPQQTTITKQQPKNTFDIDNANIDKLIGKRELKFPDYRYIIKTHSNELYVAFMKLLNEFKDIFATHQYHRRNLNIEPVKLGLKEEAYKNRIAITQPTLSQAKTKAAEAIAVEHVNSGFFVPDTTSIHNVPYGLLIKRGADGTPDRFKEFYDFRELNKYVNIRSAKIPTIPQVTQWMEKAPFILLSKFDKKNWYYQIPLHKDDQQFTSTKMPNGRFIHTAFGYGHANGPATGQDLSDKIANESIDEWNDMMAWIDDDIMKHLLGAGVPELIGSVRNYFLTVRKYNALLNPEKVFPFITGVEYVGFIYNNNGKEITKEYKTNLLSMEKPTTQHDLQNVLGSVQFIAPFTPYLAIVLYWLNQLQQKLPTAKRAQAKKTKLKWNPTAEEAWKMLKKLIKYAKMVYFVTHDGILLLRGDACSIAMANILYQWQKDKNGNRI